MCKDYLLDDAINCADFYVAGSYEFIAVHFQNIVIVCIYHQPSDSDVTVIDSLTRFSAIHQQPVIVMGDFNVHHQDWLCTTHTSIADRGLLEFCDYPNLLLSLLEVTLS